MIEYGFELWSEAIRLTSGVADRERLRDELLERVRTTATVFYEAAAENARAVTRFGDMLDHPDGAHAVLQSARREREAMQDYHRSLKALCDFLNLEDSSKTLDGR